MTEYAYRMTSSDVKLAGFKSGTLQSLLL